MPILLLLAVVLYGDARRVKGDACSVAIPNDLKRSVANRFPVYQLPRESDNLSEDIQYNLAHGGDGCLGVASGRFDQSNRKSFAFLLTSDHDVWLVAAFARGAGRWRIEKVWNAGESGGRSRLYVDTGPPGKYDDLDLGESPDRGQVKSFTAKTDVILTGRTESSEIAFTKSHDGWVHVWTSD